MSTLRKIVDEKDARACLGAVARSGETLAAWTRRHGVDGRSLHSWKRNLARRGASPSVAEPRLVELVPVARPSSPPRGVPLLENVLAAPPVARYIRKPWQPRRT